VPAFLDPGDRRILIGAAIIMVVLLALTYAFAPVQRQQSLGYPSSYSADWGGAKAAFLLLQKSGYRLERWEKSPEELPVDSRNSVLILAEPFQGASSDERMAIRRFVTAGGRVLALGGSGGNIMPDGSATLIPDWNIQPKPFSALLPSALTRNAPEITMVAPDLWTSHEPSQLAVYGAPDKPVVVSYPVGRGEVIWWASPSPLTNGSIRDKGNLALFLNSVGSPLSTRVFWDEYFHGARGSLFSYLAETPLPWAGLQIAIAFAAIMFTFSRRSSPIYVPAVESRLSPIEFVETLGDLYKSAGAAPAAVGVSYRRLQSALSRRLGMLSKAKLPELCHAAASRFGWPESALLDTLSRSERAMRAITLDPKEALELVRQLHEYSVRLDSGGNTEQEKH